MSYKDQKISNFFGKNDFTTKKHGRSIQERNLESALPIHKQNISKKILEGKYVSKRELAEAGVKTWVKKICDDCGKLTRVWIAGTTCPDCLNLDSKLKDIARRKMERLREEEAMLDLHGDLGEGSSEDEDEDINRLFIK